MCIAAIRSVTVKSSAEELKWHFTCINLHTLQNLGWATQMKNPQARLEQVGRAATEAAGQANFVGGWLCMGEYDAVMIADLPDIESMAGIALAVAAGGAIRSAKTTH